MTPWLVLFCVACLVGLACCLSWLHQLYSYFRWLQVAYIELHARIEQLESRLTNTEENLDAVNRRLRKVEGIFDAHR